MTKTILITIFSVFLLSCEDGFLVFGEEQRDKVRNGVIKRNQARIELFKTCMKLASDVPRQMDDDVSDVVDSCSEKSHYMTNYIK